MTSDSPLPVAEAPRTGVLSSMIWVNGHSMPADAAHVSALDRGFTLADGVFETMRVYNGVVFRLVHHLARLSAATSALGIPLRTDVGETVVAAVAAAREAGMREASIRITVSRGPGTPGIAPSPAEDAAVEPTVVVSVSALPAFAPSLYTAGLAVRIASGRRNEHAMTAGLKTLAYTDSIAALREARMAGADDALFLDTAGHLSEATSSNAFIGIAGKLVTPPFTCAALPGITRATVLELALGLGLAIEARPIEREELNEADEIFLTSSLRGIAPVVSVNGRPVGHAMPGPLTRRLMDEYASLVRRETAR
jgi:branched-chain amino acid aminotransferase